jgi:hypothetical protein
VNPYVPHTASIHGGDVNTLPCAPNASSRHRGSQRGSMRTVSPSDSFTRPTVPPRPLPGVSRPDAPRVAFSCPVCRVGVCVLRFPPRWVCQETGGRSKVAVTMRVRVVAVSVQG